MVNVNDFKRFVELLINKNQGGNPTPSGFNSAMQQASWELFVKRYGTPAEYQPGRPISRVHWQATQKVTDDMKQFLRQSWLAVGADGRMAYPSDYVHVSSIRYRYYENPDVCTPSAQTNVVPTYVKVAILSDDTVAGRLSSSLIHVNKKKPICSFYDGYVQYYPTDLRMVNFNYLRSPAVPVWGYTLVSGRPVYDPATSVDPEWPDEVMNELALMTCQFLGVYLKDGEVTQWTQYKLNEGV